MYSRSIGSTLLAALLFSGMLNGCKKTSDNSAGSPDSAVPPKEAQSSPPLDTIARVHWLGIKRLAAETNAAYFMSIWNLPETARLEAQTLDKLALWMAQGTKDGSNQPGVGGQESNTNGPQPLAGSAEPQIKNQNSKIKNSLLPLLEDLVDQESYLEVYSETNQTGELVLAIRLDASRSPLWQTNLAFALESLTGKQVAPLAAPATGWQLVLTGTQHPASVNLQPAISNQQPATGPVLASSFPPLTVSLQSYGAWTLLGLAQGSNSTLLADFRVRITRRGSPFVAPATNFWLDASVDLARVTTAFAHNWRLPENCPKASLTIVGDGHDIRTHGMFDFQRPLSIELDPWNIPTNLIHDPLIGFTAFRGFRPWLKSFKPWKELQIGPTPNQLFIWDQAGMAAQQYAAIPLTDAISFVRKLAEPLKQKVNPTLIARRMGQFANATNFDGLNWNNAPFISPQIQALSEPQGGFVLAGLIPLSRTNFPAPPELLHAVASRTNLVVYDWEITPRGLEHWLYLAQFFRMLTERAQFPTDSLSFSWLKATAPKLADCVTLLSSTGPNQLELTRRSTIGLASPELQLLVDWLESPKFPQGLYTLLAPVSPPPTIDPATNSAARAAK